MLVSLNPSLVVHECNLMCTKKFLFVLIVRSLVFSCWYFHKLAGCWGSHHNKRCFVLIFLCLCKGWIPALFTTEGCQKNQKRWWISLILISKIQKIIISMKLELCAFILLSFTSILFPTHKKCSINIKLIWVYKQASMKFKCYLLFFMLVGVIMLKLMLM